MCGICGVLAHGPLEARATDDVQAMTWLMRRRGPDDAGIWTDVRHVVLGVRRLAIIDPTPAGHQPMRSADGRHVVAFNGELYNYRELRRRLEAAGRRFVTGSDTEVVLQALGEWGEQALVRFNGMFAFAWYDLRRSQLVLARDPLGIKPLVYYSDPRGVVFGSQYDQVVRHPWVERARVRTDVLGLYLRLGYVPSPYGLVEGTAQLEPGQLLRVRAGSPPQAERYFDLPRPPSRLRVGNEAVDATADALRQAVGRQVVSDVPIGAFLSGGVDSPLVAAAMQSTSESPVPCFTIGSDDPNFDEAESAAGYASHLEVEHHVQRFRADDALDLVDDFATAYGEPFADHSAFPSMLAASMARSRVKVVLSGDGGDELFWGYPRFASATRIRPWFGVPVPARLVAYHAARVLRPGRFRGPLPPTFGDWYLQAHSGWRSPLLEELCPAAVDTPADFGLYDCDGRPDEFDLAQWLRRNELRGHLEKILLKVDRASMHYGLEVRVPMLDLDVLDAAFSVDPAACMERGMGKVVLRRLLARFVPESTIAAPKRGFSIPLGDWLRRDLRPLVEDLLLRVDPYPHGCLDRAVIGRVYAAHLDRSDDHTSALWSLLALQLWAATHLTGLPLTGDARVAVEGPG